MEGKKIQFQDDGVKYCYKKSGNAEKQGNDCFVTKAKNKPHLHCTSSFIGYESPGGSEKGIVNSNIVNCSVLKDVVDEVNGAKMEDTNKKAIINVLSALIGDYCPNLKK